jgi:membrane protease YdiL (CAAX protease family)
MMEETPKPTFATYAGLFLALGIPLLALTTRLLGVAVHRPPGSWQEETLIWALTAAVLCVLLFWEKLPLSAIGFRRPTWSTFFWGVAGAVVVRLLVAVAIVGYVLTSRASFAQSYAQNFQTAVTLGSLSPGLLVLLAVRAAVAEEILFRGYGIERLAAITGKRVSAGLITLTVFAVIHLGSWNMTYLIIVVIPAGTVLTVQYLWRRDLLSNIVAHFITDAIGFASAYAIAHHLIHLKTLSG